jgi:hypothetical protein
MQAFADNCQNRASNGNCRGLIGLEIADSFGRNFAIRNNLGLRKMPLGCCCNEKMSY